MLLMRHNIGKSSDEEIEALKSREGIKGMMTR